MIGAVFIETVPQIRANVAKLGFKLEDIKILLVDQSHYDHCGGLAEIKRLTKARLYASGGFFDLTEKVAKLRAGASPNPFIDFNESKTFIADMEKSFRKKLNAERSK